MLIFQSKLRQLQASGISSNIILATVHQLFGLGQICLFARLPPGQLATSRCAAHQYLQAASPEFVTPTFSGLES